MKVLFLDQHVTWTGVQHQSREQHLFGSAPSLMGSLARSEWPQNAALNRGICPALLVNSTQTPPGKREKIGFTVDYIIRMKKGKNLPLMRILLAVVNFPLHKAQWRRSVTALDSGFGSLMWISTNCPKESFNKHSNRGNGLNDNY